MRVLAISDDAGPLLHGRVLTPLRQLRAQGLIESFAVCDSRLRGDAGGDCEFDALLLQRTGAIPLLDLLASNGIPYCLDLDDNLLLVASYRSGAVPDWASKPPSMASHVLSAPSIGSRCRGQAHLRGSTAKLNLTPNSLEFPRPSGCASKLPDSVGAHEWRARHIRRKDPERGYDFAAAKGLEICLSAIPRRREVSGQNRRLPSMLHEDLVSACTKAPSIGIAPLETVAD
jgi:hypothetical protein